MSSCFRKCFYIAVFLLVVLLFATVIKISIDSYYKSSEEDIILHLKTKISDIDENFKNIVIKSSTDKSYTEDKEIIYLCLRDRNNNLYDENSLMYVLLHEITHIISEEYDTENHSEEFWKRFNNLLELAQEKKVWSKKIPFPEEYCGIKK